jgi:glutamine synthetase
MPERTGPHGHRAAPGPRNGHGLSERAGQIGHSPGRASSHLGDIDRRLADRAVEAAREADVQHVELQFADVTGAVKSVGIPARRLAAVLESGEWFDGSSLEGQAREVESDMYLHPDPSTFALLEPARGIAGARLICEVVTPSGAPFPGDGRTVLRTLLEQAESAGLHYLVAPEIEFFLFPLGDGPMPLTDDPSTYFERARGRSREVELEIVAGLEAMGILIDSSHHEVASGQFELDLPMLPAMVSADTVTTLKPAIKELARGRGMQATFMPKPLAEAAGSGMHTHQVLVDRAGRSVFDDPAAEYGLSAVARAFAAGQLEHAPGMSAIIAPLVNSYKRLVPGYEAPVAGSWGRHSRSALIRVPNQTRPGNADESFATRLELRLPDPSCNPYLAYTVMLAAGLDGLDRGLELGPPLEEVEHGFGGHSVTRPLPTSLGQALDALEEDDVICDALGSSILDLFRSAKLLEWEAYRRQVTAWEVSAYLQRS